MSSTLDLDPLWYHSLLVHIFLVNHLGFADSSIKVQWRTVWSRQITACDIFVSSHIYFEFLFADSSDTIHSQALLALSAHLDTQLEHAGKLLSRSSNTAFSSTDILHSTNPDSLHNSSLDAFFSGESTFVHHRISAYRWCLQVSSLLDVPLYVDSCFNGSLFLKPPLLTRYVHLCIITT